MINDIFKSKIHKKRITVTQNLELHTDQISDIKKELAKLCSSGVSYHEKEDKMLI